MDSLAAMGTGTNTQVPVSTTIDYMDHMPRWTLKGYAPAEVSPTEPFSVPFSHCT